MNENEEGSEFDSEVIVNDEAGEYQPRVPGWLRDAVYYAGIAASAAILIFPDAPDLVRIGAAITLVGNSLAKVYRSK